MNDDQLRKEIEQELAIEPTPQFLARVRREIGRGRRRPGAMASWALAVAGLVSAAIIGIVMIPSSKPISIPQPATAFRVDSPLPPAEIPGETPAAIRPSVTKEPKVAASQASRRSAEPEVLIDPREAEALRRFVADVQDSKIAPEKLETLFESAKRAGTSTIEPMPMAAIEPIVITPLSRAAPATGENL